MSAFADGFAKKVAKGLDLMAFHGVNPRTGTASSVIGTNHFDSKVTQAVTIASGDKPDENIEAAIALVQGADRDVTGMVLAPAFKSALAKQTTADGAKLYPQLAWGANPGEVNGLRVESTSNLSSGSSLDRALVGDFVNCFKWGYAKEIPIEVIRYGNPDNDTQLGDLKGHNQVYLRGEAYIAGASSTRLPSPTSRPASKEEMAMLYRNKKTGAVIETDCLISGGDWKPDRQMPRRTPRPRPTPGPTLPLPSPSGKAGRRYDLRHRGRHDHPLEAHDGGRAGPRRPSAGGHLSQP